MKERSFGKNKGLPSYKASARRGSLTIEVLIAFTVIILCIGAVMMVAFGNQSTSISTETNHEALYKAESLLEKARADAKDDFNSVINSTVVDGIYSKKVVVVPPFNGDFYTKKVTSLIDWKIDRNRSQTLELTTLITNPNGVSGGDTCSSVLAGDWTNPQLTSYEFGRDLLSDTSSGFPIGDIDIKDHKLYVVVNNSNGNNLPTLFKFDVNATNPALPPVLISSMDNNPTVKAGLNAVHVVGDYAYVANANGANYTTCSVSLSCSQLQIIDLNTMSVIAKMKIPGVTGNGNQSVGTSIFYKDGIIYLGLAKTNSGPEFNMIDIGGGGAGGTPTSPVYLGGASIGNGVNSIIVKGNYAYVASPNNDELKIFNISSHLPVAAGKFDAAGGGGSNGNGKSLYLVANNLYLGRTFLNGNEFYILDSINSDIDLPIFGIRDIKNISGSNTSVNGIVVRDFLTFLLTNDDFQVLKIDKATNPYTITQYATPIPTPGGSGTSMDCEGNYIFFASVPSNDKGYIAVVTGG